MCFMTRGKKHTHCPGYEGRHTVQAANDVQLIQLLMCLQGGKTGLKA